MRSPSGLITFAALRGTTSKSLTHLTKQCVALGGTVILSSEKLLITAFNNPIKAGQWVVGAVEAGEGMSGALTMDIWTPEKNLSTISALQQMVLSLNDGWIICTEPVAYWFQREGEWTLQETRYYFLSNSNRLFLVNPKQAEGFPFRTSHSSLLRERKIPIPTTPLWGREQELATLHQWFASAVRQENSRLLTLVGVEGIGKTRLALEFAHQLSLSSSEEVIFVSLESAKNISDIEYKILYSFSEDFPGLRVDLAQVLQGRHSLIILDHVEHLQPFLAELLPRWLSVAPYIKILATSRVPLEIPQEQMLSIRPLPVPPEGVTEPSALLTYASVRLFIEEARRVRPDFVLSSNNASVVADLCRQSGGIPLVLALFAKRLNVYTPNQLLATLQKQGLQDNPLGKAVAWSFHHLPEHQKEVLCKLSVFRGSWTLESAQEILQEPLLHEHLDRLLYTGLVLAEPRDDTITFTIPPSTREYTLKFLEPTIREEIEQRFARYYIDLVRQVVSDSPVLTSEQLLQLRQYQEQILTSLEWAVCTRETETAGNLLIALVPYFENIGLLEAPIGWGEQLLNCALTSDLHERLLVALGRLYHRIGNLQQAEQLYLRAHSTACLSNQPSTIAEALVGMAGICIDRLRIREAEENAHKALTQYKDFLSPKIEADALFRLGYALFAQLQFGCARECWERAERLYRQIDDKRYLALTLSALGRFFLYCGEYSQAEIILKESIEILREIQERAVLPYALIRWGDLQKELQQSEEALHTYREALNLAKDIHLVGAQRAALSRLGELYYSLRRYRLAKQAFREACELSPTFDISLGVPPLFFAWRALLYDRLDEAETIVLKHLMEVSKNRNFYHFIPILKILFLIFKKRKLYSLCLHLADKLLDLIGLCVTNKKQEHTEIKKINKMKQEISKKINSSNENISNIVLDILYLLENIIKEIEHICETPNTENLG